MHLNGLNGFMSLKSGAVNSADVTLENQDKKLDQLED